MSSFELISLQDGNQSISGVSGVRKTAVNNIINKTNFHITIVMY